MDQISCMLSNQRVFRMPSGEQLKLAASDRLLIECDDISGAAPAVLSKLGITSLQQPNPQSMWTLHLLRWLERRVGAEHQSLAKHMHLLFTRMLLDSLQCFRECNVRLAVSDAVLVRHMIALGDGLVDSHPPQERIEGESSDMLSHSAITATFVYAMFWTLGAYVDGVDQLKLEKNFRSAFKEESKMFSNRPVYEHAFDVDQHTPFPLFASIEPPGFFDSEALGLHQYLLPTVEALGTASICRTLAVAALPCLGCGVHGSGLSLLLSRVAKYGLPKSFVSSRINFFVSMSGSDVAQQIAARVSKRQNAVYGPSDPGHHLIYFIDDVHLPALSSSRGSSALEFLRQLVEGGRWLHERRSLISVQDVTVSAHMQWTEHLAHGGLSARLLRHFHVVGAFSVDQLLDTLLQPFGDSAANRLHEDVVPLLRLTVQATSSVYRKVSRLLLPSADTPQYSLVPQDAIRAFVSLVSSATSAVCSTTLDWVRRWAFKVYSSFGDNIIDDIHRSQLVKMIAETVAEVFGNEFEVINKPSIAESCFGHFELVEIAPDQKALAKKDADGTIADGTDHHRKHHHHHRHHRRSPEFVELPAPAEMLQRIVKRIDAWNKKKLRAQKFHMHLFQGAVRPNVAIARMLHIGQGHSCVIGGGVGYQLKLVNLCAILLNMQFFTVSYNPSLGEQHAAKEWISVFKSAFVQAGLHKKHVVLFIADCGSLPETLLHIFVSYLKTDELAHIWSDDEVAFIGRTMAAEPDVDAMALFIQHAVTNVHLVLSVEHSFDGRTRTASRKIGVHGPYHPCLRRWLTAHPAIGVHCQLVSLKPPSPADWLELGSVVLSKSKLADFKDAELSASISSAISELHQTAMVVRLNQLEAQFSRHHVVRAFRRRFDGQAAWRHMRWSLSVCLMFIASCRLSTR